MQVKRLNKGQLADYIESDSFKRLTNLPITRHRALSQIRNPHAREDDTLLILIQEEDAVIAYLGAVPDQVQTTAGKEHMAWGSSLWVHPEHRGKGLGLQLVQEALISWDHKLFFMDYVRPTKRIYDKTEAFYTVENAKGIRLYLRPHLSFILPPKHGLFRKMEPLLRLSDKLFNLFVGLRPKQVWKNKEHYSLEHLNTLPDSLNAFLSVTQNGRPFVCDTSKLNWIIQNPWILEGEAPEGKSYHFSDYDRSFSMQPVLVKDQEGQTCSLMLFSLRDGHLKLPYYFSNAPADDMVRIIQHLMQVWKVQTFSCYQRELVEAMNRSPGPVLWSKTMNKPCLATNYFKDKLISGAYAFQDGEGDAAFT